MSRLASLVESSEKRFVSLERLEADEALLRYLTRWNNALMTHKLQLHAIENLETYDEGGELFRT